MMRAQQAALDTLAHAFDQGPLSASKTEIFVASFCATEDLKSQWVEYADSGRGVSLAFDLHHVRPPNELGYAVTFAPCLYRTEDKEKMLDEALADWKNAVADLHQKTQSKSWAAEQLRNWRRVDGIYGIPLDKQALLKSNEEYFRKQLHVALTHTLFDLLRIASHCKHHTFHQEAEWRLSLPHTKGAPMKNFEVLYRGPDKTIPYIAHNLFSEKLPITRVKVGPLVEDPEPVEALLRKYHHNVPISKSAIPLRVNS